MRARSGTSGKAPKPAAPPAGPSAAAIRFLSAFCREHPLDEKVFIVPSFLAGRQYGEALARESGFWVNLRFATLLSLAQEIVERTPGPAASRTLSPTAELALTDRVVRELQDEGSLGYFGGGGLSPGLVKSLHRAIRDLRLDGLTSAGLDPRSFLVESKGRELVLILSRFERALEADGVIDAAGLFQLAARRTAERPPAPAWHLSLADVRLSRVESGLVRAAAGDRLVLVPGDPVFGLERPRHAWRPPGACDDAAGGTALSRLSWLFAPAEAPPPGPDGALEIIRALGPSNECREILRRIFAGNIPFDHVEVLVPPGSGYPVIFHLLAARTGLAVTFGEGIPASFTSPGRLLFGLADWIENDFSAAGLCRLLESGDLVLSAGPEGTSLPSRTACRHLRRAMIGWGRDRYADRLEALRKSYADDLERAVRGDGEGTGEAEEAESQGLRAAVLEVEALAAAVGRLLDIVPRPGPSGGYGLRDICAAFLRIIGGSGRPGPGLDVKAREVVLARLDEIRAESGPREIALKEALGLLRSSASPLRVGASPPLPGHLHVAGFASGGLAGRPVTFVAGLDEASFPGRGLQDPVLLDEERAALSGSLPTSADDLRAGLFALASVLASLRGKVVLSYSSFDIVGERAAFPSSVVLQAFRLSRGDAGLDYSDLDRALPEAAGFIPDGTDKVFDEADWWLARVAGGAGRVEAHFPDLASGLAAAAARAGDSLTEFDGLVEWGASREDFDPVAGRKAVMSATRLEMLARCPFKYFLRYVLGVKPPEEVVYDRARWLDPLQRGGLIHEILCEFMTGVKERREPVAAARHRALMDGIAGRLIGLARERVPPPSDGIFESERRDILDALEIFLAAEEKREDGGKPEEFEKEIEREEVEIEGGGSFLLHGFIDRVDRMGPESFRILDYKTGRYTEYESVVEFGRGRAIQHALYAVALEAVLSRERPGAKPRVEASGYFFPTRRGEGREILVRDFDRGRFRRLLADLLRLLEKGTFIAGPEAKCGFCDFGAVCAGGPGDGEAKRAILGQLLELLEEGCIIAGVRLPDGGIDTAPACGGDAAAAKRRLVRTLRIFEDYDKLEGYK